MQNIEINIWNSKNFNPPPPFPPTSTVSYLPFPPSPTSPEFRIQFPPTSSSVNAVFHVISLVDHLPFQSFRPLFYLLYVNFSFLSTCCTADNIPFIYFQKRFSQASFLISTKYFQNRSLRFCLELDILQRSIQEQCSHTAVSIG